MKEKGTIRVFDLGLKLELVKQIEKGESRVLDISRTYNVSQTAVRKWLAKYSEVYKKRNRVVVEKKSVSKKNAELRTRIAELERSLGQKQMRIDYLEKVVEVASEKFGTDIEKKSRRPS